MSSYVRSQFWFANVCAPQDDDAGAVRWWFDEHLSPHRRTLYHDDFTAGLKLETLLERVRTSRWLVPVLSRGFVEDGEACDFVARAQYSRPHAIVPVVWTAFHTDDLTINSLLDTAEPVTWPGDRASDADKTAFWKTLLERTDCVMALDTADEGHETAAPQDLMTNDHIGLCDFTEISE